MFRRRFASIVVIAGLIAQVVMVTTPVGVLAASAPQLTVGVNDGVVSGAYVGFNSNVADPNPQDLTAAGATDWRIWGATTTSLAGDDRKTGGTGISDLADIEADPAIPLRALGTVALDVGTGASTVPFDFSWTDGATNQTVSNQRSGLQHDNASSVVPGYGFSFTVPATGSPSTLKVWVSAHHSTGILTATVDGYDAVTNTAISGGQNHGGVYTIDFAGDGTPGQLLTVSYVLETAVAPGVTDSDGLPSTAANVAIYAAALAGNLVTNGSFEQPVTSNPDFVDVVGPSDAITGWHISSGSIGHIRSHWTAADGLQSIDLEGTGPGAIEQAFPSTAGADYRLTFQYSANPDGGSGASADRTADVLVNGVIVDSVSHPQLPFAWLERSLIIHATGTSTTLAFHSTASTTAFGIAIDAVSVVQVADEPTAEAPTLTGFYHVGLDTYYAGRMPADPNSDYDLTFASSAACPGGVIPSDSPTFKTTTIHTLDGGGTFFFRGKLTESITTGPNVAVRISGPGGLHSDYSNCVIDGPDNDTWPRAFPISLSGPTDAQMGTASGFLDVAGRERWYKFTVQPGASVQVSLTGLPADYDLVLFKDIGATYNALTDPASTTDLNKLSAEFASSGFTSSGFTSSGFTSSGFTDSVYSSSGFTSSGFTSSGFTSSGFTSSGFTDDAFSSSGFTSSGFTSSGFTSSGFTSSGFTDSVYSSSGFTSSGFTDAFSGAQTRSLVAISAATGTGDEFVSANTWTNTGDYYIRVSGKNGASNQDAPFSLAVNQNGTQCAGVGPTSIASTTVPTAGPFKTIILTDLDRIAGSDDDVTALDGKLAAFALRADVGGVVVDLADDDKIDALNAQADLHPACVYAKNLLADAIRDIVTGYRDLNQSTMQYVVLAGGDDVIPFFRYPDNSDLGPESTYVPPVSSNSASEASLRFNYVLSQDAYGAGIQISLYASSFPIPDMAVGRLVETASEVSGMLDAYTATGGVVVPHSSLVTGYDFLEDAARAAAIDLSAGVGSVDDDLISPFNMAPDDPLAWTATKLKEKLLDTRHDLVFLAGHFSANSALAADFKTSVLTTDLASSALDQSNVIVLSIGCHSGYNIVDGAAVPGVTLPLDWAQAFAQKKMTGILGTGYQYGDTDFIAYSERIYTDIAHRLRYGSGPVAIGKALVQAKLAYLKATPDIRGLHEKALREATLYGLPMLGVDLPSGRGLSDDPGAIVGSLTGYPMIAGNPGYELGLQTALVSINPTLESHTVPLKNLDGFSDLPAIYYSGPDGVLSNPGEPAIPMDSVNVTQSGYVLRGVGFIDGSYTDESVVPLNGAPATELKAAHTPFNSPTFFPSTMWTPSYYGALSQAGETRLLVTPAQHRAINPGDAIVTLRKYGHLGLKLFFSNSIAPGAGSEAPSVSEVTAQVSGGDVTFNARVVGDPRAGVQEVWVTYTGLANGSADSWTSVNLDQDSTESSLWSKTIPLTSGTPTQLSFIVQAVSGFGRVAVSDNAGAYHKVVVGSATPPVATSLALDSSPASVVHGSVPAITATISPALEGKAIDFTIGTSTKRVFTEPSGVATAYLPISSDPGTAIITATFAGDATSTTSATSRPITITKVGTAIVMTPNAAPVTSGADTEIVATLTNTQSPQTPLDQRTIYFVVSNGSNAQTKTAITDYLGRASLGTVNLPSGSYTVTAYFLGSIPQPSGPDIVLSDTTYDSSSAATPTLTPLVLLDPVATVTSVAPASIGRGAVSFPVTITGTGFGADSTVTISGTGVTATTTPIDATHLSALVSVTSGATLGNRDVTVANPGTAGGTCTDCLDINQGPYGLAALPTQMGRGAVDETISIVGFNFVSGTWTPSSVVFSGTDTPGITVHSVTRLNSLVLLVNLSIDPAAALSARSVTVINPDGGRSTAQSGFTVVAAPSVTSVSPNSRGRGAVNETLVITGANFRSGIWLTSAVDFSGSGITVNSVSRTDSSHLSVRISISSDATTGARDLTVRNVDGGRATKSGAFTVNPAPGITSLDPNARARGATNQTITILGSNFLTGTWPTSSVTFSGSGITVNTVTRTDETHLSVKISIASNAATGARSVTVRNLDGGRATLAGAFTVGAKPTLTSFSPSSLHRGQSNQSIVLNGTGFVDGATVAFSGSGITVNSVTWDGPTKLTINIDVASGAPTGNRNVTVTNPDQGAVTRSKGFKVT